MTGKTGLAYNTWEYSIQPTAAQAKTGLRVLLLALSSLFFLFIVAFMGRSQFPDYESLTAPWQPLVQPWALWANTGLLVCASASLQWARMATRKNQCEQSIERLIMAGVFTLAFLAGQVSIWLQLMSTGNLAVGNPAYSFFYLLTGLHGLHLVFGLGGWAITSLGIWRGLPFERTSVRIELCATYWHFLLAVWLVLFALLTSPPETFEAFAALCGLR
jgi:cytochrome c oxidase subunit III